MYSEYTMNEIELRLHLDRLVAGDLDEQIRSQVIQFLESNPRYWRDLGIAFLEAQLWGETLTGCSEIQRSQPQTTFAQTSVLNAYDTAGGKRLRFQWTNLYGLAAAVLISFALGWATDRSIFLAHHVPNSSGISLPQSSGLDQDKGQSKNSESHEHLVWATRPLEGPGFLPGARIQIPLDPSQPYELKHDMDQSNYEKQLMARQGIELSTQRQFINAVLPNGSQVAVPVDRVVAKRLDREVN